MRYDIVAIFRFCVILRSMEMQLQSLYLLNHQGRKRPDFPITAYLVSPDRPRSSPIGTIRHLNQMAILNMEEYHFYSE